VAVALVQKRKWLVIDERPPQPPRRIARIEAVARTPIMGFREDVSIRIAPDGEGSKIDIRSSSRYFESDLGSNAARVTKLIEDINAAVDKAPAAKKPPANGQAAAGEEEVGATGKPDFVNARSDNSLFENGRDAAIHSCLRLSIASLGDKAGQGAGLVAARNDAKI
jgi:hypothetical protein